MTTIYGIKFKAFGEEWNKINQMNTTFYCSSCLKNTLGGRYSFILKTSSIGTRVIVHLIYLVIKIFLFNLLVTFLICTNCTWTTIKHCNWLVQYLVLVHHT